MKSGKMQCLSSILSLFGDKFNKFNNTGAWVLDSVYHMMLRLFFNHTVGVKMLRFVIYEGCSNMNASSFITFFTHMLQQNGKSFYKGLYVAFKLTPDLKKNTVYLSNYSPLNEGHVSILT